MTSATAALALLVAGILIALAMIIWFLKHVYDCGGPNHVVDVARALREVYDPNWIWPTFRDRAGPGVSPYRVTASW